MIEGSWNVHRVHTVSEVEICCDSPSVPILVESHAHTKYRVGEHMGNTLIDDTCCAK